MSYATVADWSARFGELDENLDPVVVTDALAWSSRRVDELIGRRSLEPKTVTDHRWTHETSASGDRHVFLPDWPPRYPERWFCTLTALELFDRWGESQQTVTVGDCVVWPERQGLVILPDANYCDDGWTVQASYVCGFGADVSTPNIPEVLVQATLDLAEARVGSVLAVGRRVDRPQYFVEADVKERLRPWTMVAVA